MKLKAARFESDYTTDQSTWDPSYFVLRAAEIAHFVLNAAAIEWDQKAIHSKAATLQIRGEPRSLRSERSNKLEGSESNSIAD